FAVDQRPPTYSRATGALAVVAVDQVSAIYKRATEPSETFAAQPSVSSRTDQFNRRPRLSFRMSDFPEFEVIPAVDVQDGEVV
ncbi:hypothetical protein EXE44_19190, partial [Halorubrum sp. SS7]